VFVNKNTMNYWLVKTEPETFSWENLERESTSMWEGVRNFQARNNLRKMKINDTVFIYHSGKIPGIIGLAEVAREHYTDPTANKGDWSAVDLKPVRRLKRFIRLEEIKQTRKLNNMALVRNSRLSVQPVTAEEYHSILEMEEDN
jgi:predicted RNA-binding protein with PUA-like domain